MAVSRDYKNDDLGVAYLIDQTMLLGDAAAPSTFGFTLELLWLASSAAGTLIEFCYEL